MNSEIEKIFNNFVVDDKLIPIEFVKYKGKSKTYITYHEIDNEPVLCRDDLPLYSADTYDIDIYTDGNFLNIIEEVKKKMLESDWVWIEDSHDMYEEDTRLYHKTITFAKERSVL